MDNKRALVNIAVVQRELARLQFDAVMCGHQHVDFRKPIFLPTSLVDPDTGTQKPLYVLSAGTAIQREQGPSKLVHRLSSLKERGLRNAMLDVVISSRGQRTRRSQNDRQQHNSFCVYDFQQQTPAGPYQISILPHVYRSETGPDLFEIVEEPPLLIS